MKAIAKTRFPTRNPSLPRTILVRVAILRLLGDQSGMPGSGTGFVPLISKN